MASSSHDKPAAKAPSSRKSTTIASHSVRLALEPRLVFDAALVATIAEVNDQGADAAAPDSHPDNNGPDVPGSAVAPSSYGSTHSPTVVVVDARSPERDSLVASAGPGREVVVVAADADPVNSVTAALADRRGIDSLHLVGFEGEDGLRLGSAPLTEAIVTGRGSEIAGWRDAFEDPGTITVHGSRTTATAAFAESLGDIVGLDAGTTSEPLPAGRTVVVVDGRIADTDRLLEGLPDGVEVVRIGAEEDGIAAVARAVSGGGVASLQIISHGTPGSIVLGRDSISSATLVGGARDAIAAWGLGLTAEADILLLGCNVAETEDGKAFVAGLAALTGADVAASVDSTGSAALGGDWDMETRSGQIDSALALDDTAIADYAHLLAAPTISDAATTVRTQIEDTALVISGITVGDADPADTTLRLQLTVDTGTITLAGVSGLTFNAGTANGSATIDVTGSLADLNAAIGGMVYRMGLNASGSATLTITAIDLSLASSTRTVSLAVTPVNDAPTPVVPGLTVAEGQKDVSFSTANLNVVDVDNLPEQVMIRIDSLPTTGTLRFNGFGVVVGSTFSLADLAKLTYSHGGADVRTGDTDHFSISVNDGAGGADGNGAWSASQAVTISLTPVNQAPIVGFAPGGTFYEGRQDVPVGLTITDRESGHADSLANSRVEIVSLNLGGEGVLYRDTNGNGTFDTGEAVAVGQTFSGEEAAQLRFSHYGSETNRTTPPSFTVRVTDAGGGHGSGAALSTERQITIPVVPVNDDPVLAVNAPLLVAEGTDTRVLSPAELSVTDVDTLNRNLLVYLMESRPTQGVIQLNIDRTGGANWKTLGIGGRFTQEDIDQGRVRYVHQGDGVASTDSFTFSVRDSMYQAWPVPGTAGAVRDGAAIATKTFTINIADATPGGGTISDPDPGYGGGGGEGGGGEGGGGGGGSPTDPGNAPTPTPIGMTNNNYQGSQAAIPGEGQDALLNQSMLKYQFEIGGYVVPDAEVVYTVTGQPANGWLELKAAGVWTRIHDYGTFTQQDINLGNVRFVHDSGEDFHSSFNYIVSNGGPHSVTSTFEIKVAPTNDRPSASAGTTVTTTEGGTVRITGQQIRASDVDLALQPELQVGEGAKDNLWFRVLTLPADGALQRWNGTTWVAVTTNDWLPIEALTATGIDGGTGALRYVHAGGDQAANFTDGFTVEVRDDLGPPADAWSVQTGLAAPAANNLSDTASITIEIAPLNDAPLVALTPDATDPVVTDSGGTVRTGVNNPLTVAEGQTNVSLKDHLAAVDPDNTTVQRQFRITDATDHGTLRRSGVALGVGSVFTQDDLDSGRITYTHDGSETVTDSFSFVVSDGVVKTAVARFDIIITPANDKPTLTGPGTIAHGNASPLTFTGGNAISITDLDLAAIGTGEQDFVQVTVEAQNPNARLNLSGPIPGLTVIQGGGRGEKLVIQGSAAAVQQALNGLSLDFVDEGGNPADVDGAVSVKVSVDDRLRDETGNLTSGANGGPVNQDGTVIDGTSNVATHTFTVYASATPDDPTFVNIPSSLSVNEEAALAFTGANRVEIADVDAFPIASATGSIRLLAGNGNLRIGDLNGATVTAGSNDSGDLTLTGTLAQLNAALLTLTYTGKLNYTNTLTPDQITVRVLANTASGIGVGGASQVERTIQVTVNPVNDAPVVTAPSGTQTASTTAPVVFSTANGNAISVTDVDVKGVPINGMAGTNVIRITLDPTQGWTPAPASYGVLKLASTAGITFVDGITYDPAAGHTVTSTSGAGGPLVIEGTIDAINAALDGLSYTSPNNIDRTVQLRVTADDRANGGTGAKTDAKTIQINASSDNDPPQVTVPAAQTVDEDTSLAFNGEHRITVADPDDFGGTLRAELRVTNGTLSVTNTTGVTGNNTATLVITGTEAHINTVLAGLSYRGALNFHGSDSLVVKVFDNGNTGNRPGSVSTPGAGYEDGSSNKLVTTQTVDITVTPVNDAPVFGSLAGPVTYTENGPGIRLDADATISDVELGGRAGGSGDWNGAVLTIARYSGSDFSPDANDVFETTGSLSFVSSGAGTGNVVIGGTTVGTYSMPAPGRIEITFNYAATNATVASVLQQITYRHDGDAPPASLVLRIQIDDGNTGTADQGSGGRKTATYDLTVNVTRHNDSPGVSGLDNRPSYVEDQPAVVLDGNVDLFDAELDAANNWSGATLTIRRNGGANAEDVFEGSGTLMLSGNNVVLNGTTVGAYTMSGGQLTITFNGQATSARVDAVVQQIAYRNTNQNPPASVTLAYIVNDGGNASSQGGAAQTSSAATVTVDITPVNDAPTLGGLPASASYAEGASPTVIGPAVTLGDIDSPDFNGGSLRLALLSGGTADDRLSIRNQGTGAGQIGFDGTTLTYGGAVIGTVAGGSGTTPLVVTFTSTAATRAAVEALIENLTFSNVSEHPDTAPRTARLTVVDGDGTALGGTDTYTSPDITLTVSRVNDAPALSGLGGTVGHTEGAAATVLAPGAALSAADLDLRGSWAGAVLTLERQGGANASDQFTGAGALSLAGNGDVVLDGTTVVGSWSTATAGRLQITFNASATPALVDRVVQNIAYRYAGDAPPASVTISWTISDANTGIPDQGATGVPLTGTGSVTVTLTATNDAPVLNPAATLVLDAIPEDTGAPVAGVASGTLVSSLIGGITDPDLTAGRGIAVVGADASQGTWWFSTDGGASWSALGTPSEGAARLLASDGSTRIHFQPNADWNGVLGSALTIRAWDLSAGSNGGTADITTVGTGGTLPFSTASDTVSLTVTPVNDAPTLSGLPASASYAEGASPTVIGPAVTLGDIDSPDFNGGSLRLALLSGGTADDRLSIRNQGTGAGQIGFDGTTLTYGGAVIGTVAGGSGTTPLVVTFTSTAATRAAVEALIENLTFSNVSEHPDTAPRTARLTVVDGDGTALGGTDTYTSPDITLTVSRVNDAPALSGLGGTVGHTEGAAATVLAPGAALSDADLDLRGSWAGAVLTLERQGGANASDQFTGAGALSLAGNGDVVLDGTTVVGSWSTATAGRLQITFNASATPALVDRVVQNIAYRYAGDAPPASVTISWTISDANTGIPDQGATGVPLTGTGSVTVTLTATNDAPVLNPAATLVLDAIPEDTGAPVAGVASGTLVSSLIGGITDPDLTAGRGIAVVGADASQGTWWFSTDGGASWSALGTPSEGAARLLASDGSTRIHFQPNADWNGVLGSALTIRAWDLSAGSNGGTADITTVGTGGTLPFSTASDTVSLTVTPVNDAPVLSGLGGTLNYAEAATAKVLAPAAALSDVELGGRDNWAGAVLTLSRVVDGVPAPNAQDRFGSTGTLQFANGGDVTVDGVTVGTWSAPAAGQIRIVFGANATTALAGQVLSQITFANDAASLPASISVGWHLSDGNTGDTDQGTGGALVATGSVTVVFAAVNDPPVNTAPTAVTTREDTPFSFTGSNRISIADPDAENAAVQVRLVATNGTITLSRTTGLTFTVGDGTGDPIITMTGTITDINAALDGLVFLPGQDFGGSASLRIVTNDLGNAGSGGAKQDDVTIAIAVTPVADMPTLSASASGLEDTAIPLVINAAATDTDGSESLRIVIANIPEGSRLINGAGDAIAISGGSATLTAAQLAGLAIIPPANRDVSFTLTVTAIATEAENGDSAQTSQQVTVAITPVNDAPQALGTLPDRITAEETPIGYLLPPGLFGDIDTGDTVTLSAQLAGGAPLPGWLRFDPATGSFTATPARGDAGSIRVEVVATDRAGASVTIPYSFVVTPLPEAPVVTPPDTVPPVPAPGTGTGGGGTPPASNNDPITSPTKPADPGLITNPPIDGDDEASGNGGFQGSDRPGENGLLSQSSLFDLGGSRRLELLLVGSPGNRVLIPEQNATFQVPRTIFRHSNPGERLAFEAKRPNGEPLPGWLRFDTETLTFIGRPPADAIGNLDVVIVARDTRGAQAAAPFRITITRDVQEGGLQGQGTRQPADQERNEAPQVPPEGNASPPAGIPPTEAQPSEQVRNGDAPARDDDGALLDLREAPSQRAAGWLPEAGHGAEGSSSLAAQIRQAGRAGLYAEGRALLDSLARAPQPQAPDLSRSAA
ncbi:DUF4347 domain-containing protein [Arenibaculum pallidiluteum]|uniref:DUF4347 domain-containing protein n=1 Tax=Arenibaculum pallidiluteum TaxID=2812559 RepID=UPI001F455A97|nr:cadherin-like domain-containing protein [Arenibaculum pallidiluteum]